MDHTSSKSRGLSERDIHVELNHLKEDIDSRFNYSEDEIVVFVKLLEKEELVQIGKGEFPYGIETTYNILKDKSGHIIATIELPYSASGDWNITLTHYFDKLR